MARRGDLGMTTTVGVVLATYNGERYIEEQFDSLLAQTRIPDRIVITDDASTDATGEILSRIADKYSFVRVHRNKSTLGYVKNFERGISLCDTDIIALSDQDDIWLADKLEVCTNALMENPKAGLCYHNANLMDEDGTQLGATLWEISRLPYPLSYAEARKILLRTENPILGFALVFHRDLKQLLLPMPGYRLCGHDWWICALGFFVFSPIHVRMPLANYRMHPGQASGAVSYLLGDTPYAIRKPLFDAARIKRNIKREVYRIFNRRRIKEARQQDLNRRRVEFAGALDKLVMVAREKGNLPEEIIKQVMEAQHRLIDDVHRL